MLSAAFLISFFIGFLFIRLVLNNIAKDSDLYIHLILSLPIGMGISALVSFFSLLLLGRANFPLLFIAHISLLSVLLILNIGKNNPAYVVDRNFRRLMDLRQLVLVACLLIFVLLQVLPFFITYPYGLEDALTCWNLKPRFMLFSDNWLRAFSPGLTAVDYPLLLPLNVLWGWLFSGQDSPACPIFVAIIYLVSIILFIFACVRRYFGFKKAFLAASFLASVPSFLMVSILQYGDIALSCYVSIAIVCSYIGVKEGRLDYLIIGQLALGFSAFTKDEGILAFLALNSALTLYGIFNKDRKLFKILLPALGAPIAPLLALMIFKKLSFNAHNMFFSQGVSLSLFLSKAGIFLSFISTNVFAIYIWSLFWYVFIFVFILYNKKMFLGERLIMSLSEIFIFAGYFIVFILKTEPPLLTLNYTYQRAIVHLLPALCFLIMDTIMRETQVKF